MEPSSIEDLEGKSKFETGKSKIGKVAEPALHEGVGGQAEVENLRFARDDSHILFWEMGKAAARPETTQPSGWALGRERNPSDRKNESR
jgi:hypothetical protein